ncbi:tetratricopeptide repeat protein [Massilia sp. S19_KUP03_FR1]|uniref:tetratricopeptide repeat protein n=1 Tax=Massilia sp. S19_KUP03_FR1 TaxID=3025503 RepID=UPI002FCD9FBC
MKTWSLLFLISLIFLPGCASMAPHQAPPPAPLFADAAFRPPSGPVDADDLFTLSPSMRAYLRTPAFASALRQKGAVQGLVDALYRKGALQIQYDASSTRTAAQTFDARAGNCLSLVVMTAAFARELGLSVRLQSVAVDDSWSRANGLYLVSAHINLALGPPPGERVGIASSAAMTVVDFVPQQDAAAFPAVPVHEDEVAAMFLNNRAAEALVDNRIDDAYWWARAALLKRPSVLAAYNTLAVIYQRHGDLARAEAVYRAALVREPENLVVLRNLEPVLTSLGKHAEAQALVQRLAAIEPTPPFYFFQRGVKAYEQGDYAEARALFAREVKRMPYYDEFHFWLALAYLRLGESEHARTQLALASETSTRGATRDLYSAKLAHLRSLRSREGGVRFR